MKGDVGMVQIMKKNTNKKMLQPKTKINIFLSLTTSIVICLHIKYNIIPTHFYKELKM